MLQNCQSLPHRLSHLMVNRTPSMCIHTKLSQMYTITGATKTNEPCKYVNRAKSWKISRPQNDTVIVTLTKVKCTNDLHSQLLSYSSVTPKMGHGHQNCYGHADLNRGDHRVVFQRSRLNSIRENASIKGFCWGTDFRRHFFLFQVLANLRHLTWALPLSYITNETK